HFISINDGNKRISVNNMLYKLTTSNKLVSSGKYKEKNIKDCFFNRLPRRRMSLMPKKIQFEAPPMSLDGDKIPLFLRMGGSMVMSGRSMMMGNYTSLLSSVLFPILNSKYSDKQKKEYEERRKVKYREYLRNKEQEILVEKAEEEKVLKYNYPDLMEVLDFSNSEIRLWERRKTDDDFLNIRIGHGKIPLLAEYEYQKERFMLDEDKLEQEMYNLIYRPVLLQDVPIMNSLVDNYVCGVSGREELRLDFIRNFILQIVMTHSYDEVKLFFLADQNDLNKMNFMRYLSHLWDDERTIRFIATNTIDSFQLSEYLKKEIEEDIDKGRDLKKLLKERPYYVVIALDKKIFDSMEVLKDIMQNEKNVGVSVVTAFDDLPKDCSKIFQLHSNNNNSIIHIKELDKKDIHFQLDYCDLSAVEKSMKQISNKHLKIITESYSLPKMITFLEMFNVGKIEHLNPLQRWKNNNPIKSLSTPVGVATDGTLFQLDLHQKYQGPHGLIAGMTGSGKSEFIITYILSLAINYHPDEVAFLLIDYKGGGLAGAFEDKERGIRLPHLVGTITNLDGSMIQRSLMSIQSELTRRQKKFNEVKRLTGEASIDIYSYQNLYRNKVVNEALPHLFIIADEFAELKQQQPEFMEQLMSAARIGRSLGVHLILATQKPSGIVNDQIRSNTKFRVCLKVQDKADSMDMLKRSEAAELKDTGRFYLQVGYNDYFALGQSAWAGAMYEPQDKVVKQKNDSIQFIDELGQTILETKKQMKSHHSGKTQLTAIVNYLSNVAKREGIQTRQLWMNPLPAYLDFDDIPFDVKKHKNITVPIGLLDAPMQQKQFPMYFNLQSCKNLWIVGETKSGKTTLIQTILLSLIQYYTSQEVNFYILDYSSRMLKIYKNLPHCGAVLDEDDYDQLDMFFDLLKNIILERKKMFKRLEVDSYEAANQIEKIPMIFVFI
ncbi:MAG: type VII secretion protein EssC, partial [Faecalibacillus sp.]